MKSSLLVIVIGILFGIGNHRAHAQVTLDPSSPKSAAADAADQLLAVLDLDIQDGSLLYGLTLKGARLFGQSTLWMPRHIKSFEIRELNGKLLSQSRPWTAPGEEFSLPDDAADITNFSPTSKVVLDRPFRVLVYGHTPPKTTYLEGFLEAGMNFTTVLLEVTTIRQEDLDANNWLNIQTPFSGQLFSTVTLEESIPVASSGAMAVPYAPPVYVSPAPAVKRNPHHYEDVAAERVTGVAYLQDPLGFWTMLVGLNAPPRPEEILQWDAHVLNRCTYYFAEASIYGKGNILVVPLPEYFRWYPLEQIEKGKVQLLVGIFEY